jgi:hypothetical protein
MPLPFDNGDLLEFSHSSLGGLWFPTLLNVASPSLVVVNVISPLPSPIALEPCGPSHVFVYPILNPQAIAPKLM